MTVSAGIMAGLPFNGGAEPLNFGGASSTACGFLRGCGTGEWKLGILWRLKAQMKATIGPPRIAANRTTKCPNRGRAGATAIEE
jgi:hypothetical protein